jgi:hypothetical protein
MPKKRVCCYIDGFNVYHAIDDLIAHLEACRLPETAQAEDGTVKFTCPPEYALKT